MSNGKLDLKVSVQCKKCGNAGVCIPDKPTDHSVITCERCGAAIGTLGQLNAQMREGAAKVSDEILTKHFRDTLGKIKNIKLNFQPPGNHRQPKFG